jgi:hypothetical protein
LGVFEPSVASESVDAFAEVQRMVVLLPFRMGFVSNVTEHVGAGVTVSDAAQLVVPPVPLAVPV